MATFGRKNLIWKYFEYGFLDQTYFFREFFQIFTFLRKYAFWKNWRLLGQESLFRTFFEILLSLQT